MAHGRFDNPIVAALAGFIDIFRKQKLSERLSDDECIEGKTCMVTGANSGLGYALGVDLAKRGGQTIMTCRRQLDETKSKAIKESGAKNLEVEYLDLSKIQSIHDFVNKLDKEGVTLDIIILNAGVALPRARKTESGLEEMFLVNYLSNYILLQLLLKKGILKPDPSGKKAPRVIFISSDSHQGSSHIDFEEFGNYFEYGVSKGMNYYSYYKLVLNTLAIEYGRRFDSVPLSISFNVICPGPVNSNIIKEAPWLLRVMLRGIFAIIFKSPKEAAKPVIYMSISEDYAGKTGEYLHMFNQKRMDEKVYIEEEGTKLWQASERVWVEVDECEKL